MQGQGPGAAWPRAGATRPSSLRPPPELLCLPEPAPAPAEPPAERRCSFCGPKDLEALKECKLCKVELLHHFCLVKEYPKAELDGLCKGCALAHMRSLAPQRARRGGEM